MCLTPLNINPRYRFIQEGSYASVQCNCNTCDECRKEKSFAFYVRAYYDYKFTKQCNGYVFADCLTYQNKFLPRYNGKPCFSSDDVRRFKENFEFLTCQYILEKLGLPYTSKNRDNVAKPMFRENIKTLIVSEYGGCYHRPHMHTTTFNRLADLINPYVLQKLIGKAWCKEKITKKCVLFPYRDKETGEWIEETYFTALGGFQNKPAKDKVVKGIGNLIYLSGYLCKDDDFYMEFADDLKNLPIKERNKFIPRTFFYRGFGASIEKYYSIDELLTGKIKTPAPATSNQDFQLVEVPKYIIRRIIYDKHKYSTFDELMNEQKRYKYYYNEKAITYKCGHFLESLNRSMQSYYDIYSFALSLHDERIKDDLQTLKDVNVYQMCLYSRLFRCRYVDGFDTSSIACVDSPNDALAYYKHVLTERINQTYFPTSHGNRPLHMSQELYYDAEMDKALNAYEHIQRVVGVVKNTTALELRAEKARQRNLYKKQHKKSNSYLIFFNKT